jgi:hypothetical protein
MKPGPADKARIGVPSVGEFWRWMPECDVARKWRLHLRRIDETFPFGGRDFAYPFCQKGCASFFNVTLRPF